MLGPTRGKWGIKYFTHLHTDQLKLYPRIWSLEHSTLRCGVPAARTSEVVESGPGSAKINGREHGLIGEQISKQNSRQISL